MKKVIYIALLEDEFPHAEAIKRAFHSFPEYKVVTFDTIREFKKSAEEETPDVVIADLNMPDGDAFQILNTPPESLPYPVLVMTSYGSEEISVSVLKAGALDYVVKSDVAFKEMPKNIKRLLREWYLIVERKQYLEEVMKLRKAVESSGEVVFLTDTHGVFTYINPEFTILYGYTAEEVVGKATPKILKSNLADNDLFEKFWEKILQNQLYKGELINQTKTGELIYVEASVSPILDENRRIVGFLSIQRDISERKKAEEALKKSERRLADANKMLNMVLDSIPLGIFWKDKNSRLLGCNMVYAKDFGAERPADVIGKTEFDSPHYGPNAEAYKKDDLEIIETGIPKLNIEYTEMGADGNPVWYLLSKVPLMDSRNEIIGVLGIYEDITKRKNVERELISAKEQAEVSEKLKSAFLAQMSHEIRSPLFGILGYVSLIKDFIETNINNVENMEEVNQYFDRVSHAGNRLIRTIDLILNMSEIQTKSYMPDFTELDLLSTVDGLVKEYAMQAGHKKLTLRFTNEATDTVIYADEYSTTQIFANLIDNALKYTEKGGVEIRLYNSRPGTIVAEVNDTGIGISKEFMNSIFRPFSQEEIGYCRKFDGNGLGLALVKSYCDLNNATIEVESEKGKGTSFRIKFNNLTRQSC